ncbi:MAG: UDP-N-acetylmuramoyl-L-alanyl-D-glutamate--2,6-diaminopimelate ligase [Bacteroidales bacterium]|nr:UDP-N-acetylmuramoyl-L-alanyl-D-glutamate--2,6-diaminopimelate ligase [Bacteroidales bacterium]
MKLEEIISGLDIIRMDGEGDPDIRGITFDSRKVSQGDLFVAIMGYEVDGHRFIDQAFSAGASVIVCEEEPRERRPETAWIRVPDSRKALALMASVFYGHPSRELHLVGITGTNGKTTIATLLHQLHTGLGFRSGLLSTIQVLIGDESHPATHTTPDPVQINAYLRKMVETGCEYCFMEVSSHAIDQDRIEGLEFNGGVFTNLTRDHLDYHKDFREYLTVKKRFFDQLAGNAFVLVNGDDKNGKVMIQNCDAEKYTYSLRSICDFRGKINEMHLEGSSLSINDKEVWVKLPGRFNVSNLLCVYATSVLLGQHPEDVIRGVSEVNPVPGRFETFRSGKGTTGIVDYAHTPDALQNVLDTIHEVNVAGGEIITVIGAGGNRDRGKRPEMARIAAEGSQKVILTSDNPRYEDPDSILDDMMGGVPPGLHDRTMRIVSREEAIRTACIIAGQRDIILLAGKGHENYQEIKGERIEFDDMQILKRNLN